MVGTIERFLRHLRKIFSRSYWAIHLLRLSVLEKPTHAPGLVMVQIDGLALIQFNKGLKKKHLPFLDSLLVRERYILHKFYSGLPSNTPAVQAELFYGIKGCVPSFSFVDRKLGKIVRMFDAPYVEAFEPTLKAQAEGLLKGGSSYSNIYTGGADEAHFCWAQLGIGGVLHAANPLVFPFLVILYIDIFVKTFFLLVVEFFIALFECFKGTLKGRMFSEELRFVWLRVLICVFLRELMVAGACMDIMRGLPIIHLNFLGYDEQAHCRGPFSRYAHWALQGIDDAIKRIDKVMKQSPYRHYDLWVYSDHGQERTDPYFIEHGRTVEDAIEQLFGSETPPVVATGKKRNTRHTRANLLSSKKVQTAVIPNLAEDLSKKPAVVAAMGPLGQVYVNKPLQEADYEFYARKMVDDLKIPLVLTKLSKETVKAYTPQGTFTLPQEADRVFGDDHPFLSEIKEDIIRICHHPNAGEFVIAGWSKGEKPISFPLEYGAHAAMGAEETEGFALLPMDTPLDIGQKDYVRALDLNHAAQRHLHPEKFEDQPIIPHKVAASQTLRLMSYNVHGCLGMDGSISPSRIARVIARYQPDIIALQEVDAGRARSHGVHQVEKIAKHLRMNHYFHPVMTKEQEQYGNVIFSRLPLNLVKMVPLPKLDNKERYEPRGAMCFSLNLHGKEIQVINTHLSIWPGERMVQANALLEPEWLSRNAKVPVILCGDFNAIPGSGVYKKICTKFKDSQSALRGQQPYRTWFGRYPLTQIDYVFISEHFQIHSTFVPRTNLEKISSDHLPLIVDLSLISL